MISYTDDTGKRWYKVCINGIHFEFANRTWAWRAVSECSKWGNWRVRRSTR